MEIFSFFPQVIFIVAVAAVVVFLAWKFPKSKKKKEIEKRVEEIAQQAKQSKVSDIKMSKNRVEKIEPKNSPIEEVSSGRPKRRARRIPEAKSEHVDVSVLKSESIISEKKARESVVQEESTVAPPQTKEKSADQLDLEREKALKTKKEMHENVLKVIDRVAHIAKRTGALVKSGAVATAVFVRKQRARLKKRRMTPAQIDQEKLLDALEKAAMALGASQFEKAEAKYIDAIKIDPRNVRAYKGLAELYEKQDNFEYAIASLEQVMKLEPLDPTPEKKIIELRRMRAEKKLAESKKGK